MEFKFDYQAAMQQLKDMVAIDFMASLAPDEKTKSLFMKSWAFL